MEWDFSVVRELSFLFVVRHDPGIVVIEGKKQEF